MGSIDTIDLVDLQRRARLSYELARARRALLGILPVVVMVALVALFTHRLTSTLWPGVALVAAGAVMLWYGRDPQRAVLPGVAAGLVPLVLAIQANAMHSCAAGVCSSLCVPACAVGGVVAGLVVAGVGARLRAGAWFWVSASSLALLTGAMGCACAGYAGIVGLGIGFGGGMIPGLLFKAFTKRTS